MAEKIVSFDVPATESDRLLTCCCCFRTEIDYDGLDMSNPDRWRMRDFLRMGNGCLICEACFEAGEDTKE